MKTDTKLPLGTCALCREKRELKNSHYIPASIYKLVMQGHEPADKAPVMVSTSKQSAAFDNRQYRRRLLCDKCEDLFSKNGEKLVVSECKRNAKEFVLREKLQNLVPSQIRNNRKLYEFGSVDGLVEADAYAYFAASILWRGSVTRWNSPDCDHYFGALGNKFEEEIRLYLREEASFPASIEFNFYVDFDPEPPSMFYTPHKSKDRFPHLNCRKHHFFIPGIRIVALVGGRVGSSYSNLESGRSVAAQHVTFFEWHSRGTNFSAGVQNQFGNTRPKGSLKRKLKL